MKVNHRENRYLKKSHGYFFMNVTSMGFLALVSFFIGKNLFCLLTLSTKVLPALWLAVPVCRWLSSQILSLRRNFVLKPDSWLVIISLPYTVPTLPASLRRHIGHLWVDWCRRLCHVNRPLKLNCISTGENNSRTWIFDDKAEKRIIRICGSLREQASLVDWVRRLSLHAPQITTSVSSWRRQTVNSV